MSEDRCSRQARAEGDNTTANDTITILKSRLIIVEGPGDKYFLEALQQRWPSEKMESYVNLDGGSPRIIAARDFGHDAFADLRAFVAAAAGC